MRRARRFAVAVADSGPIIHLSWVNQLDCLQQLFEQVLVPDAVRQEVLQAGPDVPGVEAIRGAFEAGWLTTRVVADMTKVQGLSTDLDTGEAEAIVLMEQVRADILLLDDRRARKRAQDRTIPITGTIGLLRLAREHQLLKAIGPILEDLRRQGFRISHSLLEEVLVDEEQSGAS